MAKIARKELAQYLVSPERSGLKKHGQRQLSTKEILKGIDSANRKAGQASEEVRARLRRESAA